MKNNKKYKKKPVINIFVEDHVTLILQIILNNKTFFSVSHKYFR